MGTLRKGAVFPLRLLNMINIAQNLLGRAHLRRKSGLESGTKRLKKISDTIIFTSGLRNAFSEFLIT